MSDDSGDGLPKAAEFFEAITVNSTFTLNIPPWFPFTLHFGDCTITLFADGKWEGSVEALRTALATGKAYSDGNARMLLWLILRQMEADQRFW